jgi:hypothetical protein
MAAQWDFKWRSELCGLPLPGGERVGVRGFGPIEGLIPPHPNGEREPIAYAARLRFTLSAR